MGTSMGGKAAARKARPVMMVRSSAEERTSVLWLLKVPAAVPSATLPWMYAWGVWWGVWVLAGASGTGCASECANE